ncbi:T9SS type A sorting domain-containing protein [candidate division KSB1 bacterium]|nr:T9SS type A sorting domain-containing protein [candidate division KSB1 bacterium]
MHQYRYKQRIGAVLIFLLLLILISVETLFAQSSPNYEMRKYVLDMSGTALQSTNHQMVNAVGQPAPVGEIFSQHYTLSAGFLGKAITIAFRGTKLTASDGKADDTFGRALAISGDYAAIGSSHNDNLRGTDAGAVYIFKRSGNSWIEQEKLTADDGADGDILGSAIAIDGDYLVAGAPWDDDSGSESGAAYVFKREGANWIQQAKLTASDAGVDNRFGISVAISGDYALVGAFFDDDFGSKSGSAYIFKRNGTTWGQQAILKASDGTEGDWFGVCVSINGDFAAIGSRYNDNENGTDAGAVYIFKREGTLWNEQQKLRASDGAAGDLFHKAEIVGNHLVVGAYQDDDKGDNSGSIYVFEYNGSSWSEQQKLTASDGGEGDNFGNDIAISRNRMVVGAYRDSDNGSNSGSIYVFDYDGSHWVEAEKIIAYDGDAGDYYGLCVDIDQDFILVAARNDDDKGNNAGAAYIYGSMSTSVPFDLSTPKEATVFQILPAYPNPFNPETTIRYAIPGDVDVKIAVFNMLGQRVRILENGHRQQGYYSVHWDGRDDAGNSLTSGIYLCRIQAGEYRQSIKLAILK